MAYQSFGEEKGDSNSFEKLERLRLPMDLRGKSFLDIGCNEGYFCIAAQTRGAGPIIGIDRNEPSLQRARARAPGIEYRNQSWDVLPEGPHDIILMASALHYSKNPRQILSAIHNALAEDGLFILEAGVVAGSYTGSKNWIEVRRGSDVLSFPNWLLLTEGLLSNFTVRIVGPSVSQAGDPVPRFVFHCQKLKPIVLLCGGQSGTGKTTLSLELKRKCLTTFSTDEALMEMANYKFTPVTSLYRLIQERFKSDRIGELVTSIVDLGMGVEFANALFEMFPKGERVSMIEGYALHFPEILDELTRLLRRRHKVWFLSADIADLGS